MIDKFGAGEPTEEPNMMAMLNAAFTVAAGAVNPLSGPLTVISGAFGIASLSTPGPAPDTEARAEAPDLPGLYIQCHIT